MRIDYLSSDILLFRGDSMAALATAFFDGERVLLVDALASADDAVAMRDYLQLCRAKRVERIVLTHAGSVHAAGLYPGVAPEALALQRHRIVWGRHTLDVLPVAGQLIVDVASADLLLTGAAVAGSVALLGKDSPEVVAVTLATLRAHARGRTVPRHGSPACGVVLDQARAYLAALKAQVLALRSTLAPDQAACAIAALALEQLIPGGYAPTAQERQGHCDNLRQIAARGLFAASCQRAPAPAARAMQVGRQCCDTLMSVLTAMLGRLAERGV